MTDPAPFLRTSSPFATLDRVRARLTEAVLGRSGLNHPTLAAEIRRRFGSASADLGTLVQEPVIEAAFPYLAGDETLDALSGRLLHPDLVEAITRGAPGRPYAFPRELKPYRHQIEAWTLLNDPVPRSVLVASGTGSGKTECFLLPLLGDLAAEADRAGRLSGVRAIALYPLNALIASQEERLRAWTAPFGGRIRFGLYNGAMPEDASVGAARGPEQVGDRRTLRTDPPPVLVTNVTMLEYMTVRRQDRPLLEASKGKLRWIILDEAHSYVGSAAAEIALLLRRVLLAFGVTPSQVRFVATSATIGEGAEVEAALKRFLGDVAGVAEDRVHVVVGRRRLPALLPAAGSPRLTPADLADAGALARNPVVHDLVARLGRRPLHWPDVAQAAERTGAEPEALARAVASLPVGEPLIPLRVHGFLRAVPGLWACLNPGCGPRPLAVPGGEWPFGAVLPERAESCPHCGGAVLELVSCTECGEPFLDAVERGGRLRQASRPDEPDEFAAASEAEALSADEEAEAEPPANGPEIERLIATRPLKGARPLHVEPASGTVRDRGREATCLLGTHDRGRPESCPACLAKAPKDEGRGRLLRPFRYGAPFLIGSAAPVLLDGIEPRSADPAAEAPPPSGGRQLLSFTDSRQGTARFAATLQGAAERNCVRAAIYHAVQETLRPPPDAAGRAAELDARIKAFEALPVLGDPLAGMLEELRRERASLAEPRPDGLPWPELRKQLAARPDIRLWMRRVWGPRDERFDRSEHDFAQFLLLREFARRSRRANSLETLGLARLRFAAIDDLPESRLPPAFRERGRRVAEWRDFLTLLITTRVRNHFALRVDREDVRWLLPDSYPRVLLRPGQEKTHAGALTWPSAGPMGRRAVAVMLLERALGLDASIGADRALLDETLRAAWDALLPLFARPGDGDRYALDLDRAHVAPVRRAFLCPVTRRLLDTTVAGLSPYGLQGSSRSGGRPCEAVELPVHPNPFLLPERGGTDPVEAWLAADPALAALRARGLWGDLQDRIALGSPYMRAAEHSAQQPPSRLRRYEREFKAGEINILSCSTTMEMGVDIGSVSSVMMTNVPPSIASYRQRVGRAGRRGQAFATALTYARDTPLDREAFRDPAGYLSRRIEAPKVTLDSRRIVQRHATALLLAAWFAQAGGEALKARAGEFFGCPPGIGAARPDSWPAREFCAWVGRPGTVASLASPLETLLKGSALAGDQGVHDRAGEAVAAAERAFVAEWEAIQAQAAGMEREAARKSLGFQLTRMCGEPLLGELADRGVLPGHGFPTAVVPFVNRDEPDKDERLDDEGAGRENRFRRRNYPTRNLDLAIRDYAPGAEVVVDGLVYRSAGVTLNWKRPAGDQAVNEVQSLKWFWDCADCGAADTARLQPRHCSACDSPLDAEAVRRFLEPAGFTVDMRARPHAEIEQVAYVEPEPARVAARGAAWQPFPDPARGRLRASREGLVFYASSGGTGRGYAVCLECGRAEAEPADASGGSAPLLDHRPLRFTKGDANGCCPGNMRGFSIQRCLALGHDITTDVAELQPVSLGDPNAAWALASALREALARRLGKGADEMGLAVAARTTPAGGLTHSLFLYDRAAGGAGFAPRLIDLFEDVLRDARAILDCARPGCRGGCSACVLAGDLYAQAETLDRQAALAFVEAEIEAMARPDEADRAADEAALVRDAADDLAARLADGAADEVTLWPAGRFDPAALAAPRLRALLDRLTGAGHRIVLCLDPQTLDGLDAAQRLGLRDAALRHALTLRRGPAPVFRYGSRGLAMAAGRGLIWASRDERAGRAGAEWGLGRDAPVVRVAARAADGEPVDPNSLLPRAGTRFVEVRAELDGPSRGFGERFVSFLRPRLDQAGLWRPGQLSRITYTDRYVHAPLTGRLVIEAASALSAKLGPAGRATPFHLATMPLRPPQDRPPSRVHHDWRVEAERAEVLGRLAAAMGLAPSLTVGPCPHSRRLTLHYGTGEATIILDQGFGFLKPPVSPPYEFRAAPAAQAAALAKLNVICRAEGATYLVLVEGG